MKVLANKIFSFPLSRIIVGIIVCVSIPFGVKEFITKPLLEASISNAEIAKSIQHLLSMILIFLKKDSI